MTIDAVRPTDLARFGAPAGYVLTPAQPSSPLVRYRVPPHEPGRARFFLVARLDTTVEVERGGRGSAQVRLETDGVPSATVHLAPARRGGRLVTRRVGEGGTRLGTVRSRRFEARAWTDVVARATTPGEHTLRFRLVRKHGARVRAVRVAPTSGLETTLQRPLVLRGTVTAVEPASPRAGEPFRVNLTIRNHGGRPTGRIRIAPSVPGLVLPDPALPVVPSIAPGASAAVTVPFIALDAGPPALTLDLISAVGEDIVEIGLPTDVVPATR